MQGILNTGANTVELQDANQAVLGSLTTLGSGSVAGVLRAVNGLLVDFGNNVTGFGSLDSMNDIALLSMINGSVNGTSSSEPISIEGFVKGIGAFDNVLFNGTYSPGFSPAQTVNGSVEYGSGSVVEAELGGTVPGSAGYDQIVHLGTATLSGELVVKL